MAGLGTSNTSAHKWACKFFQQGTETACHPSLLHQCLSLSPDLCSQGKVLETSRQRRKRLTGESLDTWSQNELLPLQPYPGVALWEGRGSPPHWEDFQMVHLVIYFPWTHRRIPRQRIRITHGNHEWVSWWVTSLLIITVNKGNGTGWVRKYYQHVATNNHNHKHYVRT